MFTEMERQRITHPQVHLLSAIFPHEGVSFAQESPCVFHLHVKESDYSDQYIEVECIPSLDHYYFHFDFTKHTLDSLTERTRVLLSEFLLGVRDVLAERHSIRLAYVTGQFHFRFHPYLIYDLDAYYERLQNNDPEQIDQQVTQLKNELVAKMNEPRTQVIGKPIIRLYGEDSKPFLMGLVRQDMISVRDDNESYTEFTLLSNCFDHTLGMLTFFTQQIKKFGYHISP